MSLTGPKPIYGPKDPKTRFQGSLTTEGGRLFERARRKLQKLTDWPTLPSHGDTVEFLARDGLNDLKRYKK